MRANGGYLLWDIIVGGLLNGRTVTRGVLASLRRAQLSVRSSVSGGIARLQRSCYKPNRDHGTATLDQLMVIPNMGESGNSDKETCRGRKPRLTELY